MWQRKKARIRGKKMGCAAQRARKVQKGMWSAPTYRTSSGWRRGTLVWWERKTFRGGFVSRRTQTTPVEVVANADLDQDNAWYNKGTK